ncbi:Arabinose import ATP-binding protein AraG [Neomoorella glycerini]|uniref:Arabinose import ATP-binding protein AraG n=1 Tax=Neomoorella glycerini TaxID=55779 RepID=A0A6I5ZPP2_9FIRM|nr:sugar ABC transporter ATP-binding protein [Moorella glycerini]QGP91964.1 Arabinose import ATP-binding protein AraG [Moorella glycerini]
MPDSPYILEMRSICKSFPGVQALKNVDLKVKRGEIHCLLGENGAGKSTLIKILAGVYPMDAGQIIVNGHEVTINSRRDAQNLGISFIFQELNVVNQLTAAQNLTLGEEKHRWGVISRREEIAIARSHLQELGIELDLQARVGNMTTSQKQMLLIAKAVSTQAKIIVMDEPTAALPEKEVAILFNTVKRLQRKGITFIFVSHRLQDIFQIGESFTVLRDGENVGTGRIAEITETELINLMVGRKIESLYYWEPRPIGREVLRLENLSAVSLLQDISFSLHAGEILGVAGLAGSGKSELAKAIFGVNRITGGRMYLDGQPFLPGSPREAIVRGIALVPEERRSEGIVGVLSVQDNLCLACPGQISSVGVLKKKAEKARALNLIRKLDIKTHSPQQQVANLSGGNQQKVVLGKWLESSTRIYLMDEPTRGIDVGAKGEIYKLINNLAREGAAVLICSSELPELLGVCDRILVMREGRLAGILSREEANQARILSLAIGGEQKNAS